jgi:HlyD family secretion protein
MKRYLKKGAVLGAAASVAALALFLFLRSFFGASVPAFKATRHDVKERLVAMGRVLPPARINVGSLVPGNVIKVKFDTGDAVKTGELLIALDDVEATASVRQAQAAVSQAQARLDLMRNVQRRVFDDELRQAEVSVQRAELDYNRKKGLMDAAAIPRATLDDAANALESAKSRKTGAEAKVTGSGAAGADYRAVVAAVAQAEASLDIARSKLDHTKILAPSDGVVLNRDVEPGDVIQPGKTLMVLMRNGGTRLVVQVEEKSIARIKPGQKALASADAYPGRTFEATVLSVAPGVDPRRGTVEVRLSVPAPPDYLLSDMTVSVDIDTGGAADALVIPTGALRDAQSMEPWVMVIKGGKAERRTVRPGIRGQTRVEILSGLEDGEIVILSGPIVVPGQKVRAALADKR